MAKYIDIDSINWYDDLFMKGWNHSGVWVRYRDVENLIRKQPAADVRPVVLCRDCKHFNPYPGDCTDGVIEGVCKRHNSIGVLVMDEDFCSDAERI